MLFNAYHQLHVKKQSDWPFVKLKLCKIYNKTKRVMNTFSQNGRGRGLTPIGQHSRVTCVYLGVSAMRVFRVVPERPGDPSQASALPRRFLTLQS